MSTAMPPFQVDGPPYPSDLPFYQTEALRWLKGNKNDELAFAAMEITEENVKALYNAGATRVDVVVTFSQPGDGSASRLEVTFPGTSVDGLLSVIRSLHPTNWEDNLRGVDDPYADDGSLYGKTVTLSWD